MIEEINILTHLFPFLISLWFTIHEIVMNRWLLSIYCMTMAICFGLSTAYHTGCLFNVSYKNKLLTFDQIGIVVLMWGSNLPIIFIGFNNELKWIYVFITTL